MSVCSTGSDRSKEKVECPCCNKEFTQQSIFGHFYNKHEEQFLARVKQTLPKQDNHQPLILTWTTASEDLEIDTTFYGCLATKKTFMSEERARAHFKKNPSDFEDHKKEMEILRRRFQERQEREKDKVSDEEWDSMKKNNHPFAVKGIWSLILLQISQIEKILLPHLEKASPGMVSSDVLGYPPSLRSLTVQELLEMYNRVRNELRDMELDKELNWKKLSNLQLRLWRICEAGSMFSLPQLAQIPVDEQMQPEKGVILPPPPF
jgi:hypothetical protein